MGRGVQENRRSGPIKDLRRRHDDISWRPVFIIIVVDRRRSSFSLVSFVRCSEFNEKEMFERHRPQLQLIFESEGPEKVKSFLYPGNYMELTGESGHKAEPKSLAQMEALFEAYTRPTKSVVKAV